MLLFCGLKKDQCYSVNRALFCLQGAYVGFYLFFVLFVCLFVFFFAWGIPATRVSMSVKSAQQLPQAKFLLAYFPGFSIDRPAKNSGLTQQRWRDR